MSEKTRDLAADDENKPEETTKGAAAPAAAGKDTPLRGRADSRAEEKPDQASASKKQKKSETKLFLLKS